MGRGFEWEFADWGGLYRGLDGSLGVLEICGIGVEVVGGLILGEWVAGY